MSLNIKNPTVVALVRDLADAMGTTQVSAMEVALRAKLAEIESTRAAAELDADRSRRLLERIWANPVALPPRAELDERLYDTTGLPR